MTNQCLQTNKKSLHKNKSLFLINSTKKLNNNLNIDHLIKFYFFLEPYSIVNFEFTNIFYRLAI